MHSSRYAAPPKIAKQGLDAIEAEAGFGWAGLIARHVNDILSKIRHERIEPCLLKYQWEKAEYQPNPKVYTEFVIKEDQKIRYRVGLLNDPLCKAFRKELEELLEVVSTQAQVPLASIIAEMSNSD